MTLTTLPDNLKPAVAKARRAVDQVDHRSATSMDDLVAKITDAAILAFLNAAIEAGEAREANAYTNEHSSERHWTASTDYTFCHFPALILRMGDTND